ncbi:MAG: hypothetical protein GY796_12565, partial [Chloroflexi bacterium]|nr:hypothetical protein [Chloroflexota bacterium]
EAVLQFELAIEHGALWVRGMLNSLYAGDWMSFASIEGSRTALEYLSGRVWDYREANRFFFVFDDKRAAKESATYLFLSANLGYDSAKKRIKSRSLNYPDIYGVEYENTEIPWGEYRQVFCPVRAYELESNN